MRVIGALAALCLPVCGLAQGISVAGGTGSSFNGNGVGSISGSGALVPRFGPAAERPVGIGSLQVSLRGHPPSGTSPLGLTSLYRGRSSPGETYFTRTVMDSANRQYFGYEVILEEQQPGTYLATFGKLSVTQMEAEAMVGSDWKQWSMRTLALPDPKVVHDGDVLSVELMADAASGDKLIEDITVQPFIRQTALSRLSALPGVSGGSGFLLNAPVQPSVRTVPTVDGPARDFSAADAEMHLTPPHVSLDGIAQSTAGRISANVTGSLVWFYLPGHGRYILSLAPHPELDFQKAGEVRGGSIRFTLGEDTISLECPTEIATGRAPYFVYVLQDPLWEPTAQAQKGQFAMGSVDPGELLKLRAPQ